MVTNLSRYLIIALAAIVIGASIMVQGTFGYINGLANYHAELNFCKISDCPALQSFSGTQDFMLIGLGLIILCSGIALFYTELARLPKVNREKIGPDFPKV